MRGILLNDHFKSKGEKFNLWYLYKLTKAEYPPVVVRKYSKLQKGKCRLSVLTKDWLDMIAPKIDEVIDERKRVSPYLITQLEWVRMANRLMDLRNNFDYLAEEF